MVSFWGEFFSLIGMFFKNDFRKKIWKVNTAAVFLAVYASLMAFWRLKWRGCAPVAMAGARNYMAVKILWCLFRFTKAIID